MSNRSSVEVLGKGIVEDERHIAGGHRPLKPTAANNERHHWAPNCDSCAFKSTRFALATSRDAAYLTSGLDTSPIPRKRINAMKTTVKSISITRPFQLAGMAKPHPAGTFDLRIDEEPIDVMWEAYHRTMTLILKSNGLIEAWPISEEDLEKVLAVS
ncbi:hypothetical protein AB4Z25_13970 [Rhizobium sp. RAF36]|uniref:hypothetical protein n=1 Tax=Rhizobium sp. RAF36 TaxID=3233055 RepID=UPI003F948773